MLQGLGLTFKLDSQLLVCTLCSLALGKTASVHLKKKVYTVDHRLKVYLTVYSMSGVQPRLRRTLWPNTR